jgi:hypothetical protein
VTDQERLAAQATYRISELQARAEIAEDRLSEIGAARAEQLKIAERFDKAALVACVGLGLLHWLAPDAADWIAISLGVMCMFIGHADGRRTAIKRLPA